MSSRLELRIPPPLVAIGCAAIAWGLARLVPGLTFAVPHRLAALLACTLVGVGLDLSAIAAFRRARTTVNPLAPDRATAVVRTGPYRYTRNPMYLGLACVIAGVCAFLSNPLSLLAVAAFVAYVTRFQILPEERLLRARFGEEYDALLRAVRRWI